MQSTLKNNLLSNFTHLTHYYDVAPMSFSVSPAAASPSSEFLPADLPPPPQPPPEAPPPLVIGPAVAFISPPAPPLPPPSSSESVPPAVAPVAADPPLTASPPPPVPDVSPPSPPLLPPSVASPPPSLPPSVTSPPPSAALASPPAPAAIIPAAPDVSSPPPQESKPLPRHHAPIPMKPSRKPHIPPPELPSVPSSPAKPQAQPLPTLLPPPTPASPPTETSSLESPPPVSSEPFFAELPLTPPASTAASPPAELLNGSLPLTVDGGQSQSIAGQSSAREYHVSTGIIVGFAIGGVLLLAMVVLSCFVFRGRKKQKLNSGMGKDYYVSQGQNVVTNDVQYNQNATSTKPYLITIPSSRSPPGEGGRPGPALQSSLSYSVGTFTYNELTEATNNFSASNLLGEGGFGYVHKGVLSSGKEIAVKQLKMGSDQGEREFQAELDTISRVHHKHLVTLLGYCITGDARFLVYEFVSNKTLEFHLHGDAQPVMEWRTRLKIAIGSAKGLAYLHEDCSPTIIHRDIKAANILLDFNFEAKVSDFGLAKFFSDTNSHITHVSTRVVGTFGYLAPEYASSGKLTEKSDVYSYGVMLLELITGRPPISRTDSSMTDGLVDWARHLLNEAISTRNFDNIVDLRLQKNYEFDEMASLIECAAACVRHSAWLRPRMSQIVRALEEKEPLTDHGAGNTPGHSKMYSSLDMKRLTMALASQDYESSRVSDNTSDYGLYPSCSSSEAHMTR